MRLLAISGTLLLAACGVGRVPPAVGPTKPVTSARAARLMPHRPAGEGPWPVAVLLPGGRGAMEVGKAWPSYHRYAERLAARGILAAVVDYARDDRGFWDARRLVELGQAIDEAHRLPGADARRVVLVGFSMGGAYALMAAGTRSDIAGLVTFFAPVELPSLPEDKQPITYVPHLQCPVLVLQGSADVITRPQQAERLMAALQESHHEGRLEIFRRQGHGFTYQGAPMGACCNFNESATARSVDMVVDFVTRLGLAINDRESPSTMPSRVAWSRHWP
jgi:dienelactone hydrolase